MTDRIEVQRTIAAPAAGIFAVLCDPQGHVEGDSVTAAGDSFVVHMDRESLNDFPELGKYDVTVSIREFEKNRLISWTVLGQIRPQIGHVYGYRLEPTSDGTGTIVTSFYDWFQTSARHGVRPAYFRSSRKPLCGPRSAFSIAPSVAGIQATKGVEPQGTHEDRELAGAPRSAHRASTRCAALATYSCSSGRVRSGEG